MMWSIAIGWALLFLIATPQTALAQWNPSPSPSPNTNIYYNAGNVGIGTTAPVSTLDVSGDVTTSGNIAMNGATLKSWASGKAIQGTTGGFYFGSAGDTHTTSNSYIVSSGTGWKYMANGYASNIYLYNGDIVFRTAPSGTADASLTWNTAALSIKNDGNVGIGTMTPGYKLDVNGNTNVTGNITVTGNINAKYQDVAEWVPSSEQLPAGTVVVLDSTKSNHVTSSSTSYDTRVAGVISEQPGIALGEKSEGRVLVATTGRVLVRVDASRGPIRIGDLLVTSDIPGVAMKSEPIELGGRKMHMPGTLIGKALEPLEKGSGKILVLLSLQ